MTYDTSDPRRPIIDTIEAIVANVRGWSPADQLCTLFQLVYASNDLRGDVVEIGAWCGRASVVMGIAARMIGATRVHSIDLFPRSADWVQNADGTYSMQVAINESVYDAFRQQTVWAEPYTRDIVPVYAEEQDLLQIFSNNVSRYKLSDVVVPFRGTAEMFAESVGEEFRAKLVFVDGDHGYEAVSRDIAVAERFLVPGGWFCFDDAFSSYDGVTQAVEEHIIRSGRYDMCQQMTRKLFVARKKAHH